MRASRIRAADGISRCRASPISRSGQRPMLKPDLTLLLDLPVAEGMKRANGRGQADRIEMENADFFERVREAYRERAAADPKRFRMIDASAAARDGAGRACAAPSPRSWIRRNDARAVARRSMEATRRSPRARLVAARDPDRRSGGSEQTRVRRSVRNRDAVPKRARRSTRVRNMSRVPAHRGGQSSGSRESRNRTARRRQTAHRTHRRSDPPPEPTTRPDAAIRRHADRDCRSGRSDEPERQQRAAENARRTDACDDHHPGHRSCLAPVGDDPQSLSAHRHQTADR